VGGAAQVTSPYLRPTTTLLVRHNRLREQDEAALQKRLEDRVRF